MRQAGLPLFIKKAIDKSVALTTLVVTAPVFAAAAVAVKVTMGGPVLFSQVRPGYKARPIRIYKMRSMTNERDAEGNLKPDAERITRLGKFLRRSSIDELPQLFNVLRGDMSLVGPRPLLTQYLAVYSADQARRHDVLPGITGWAQIHGRNSRSWDDKFDLDLYYVDHWSLGLDLRIVIQTITAIRRGEVEHGGEVMIPYFEGSSRPDVSAS
jgi:lipopolysaccharide/colanic/teichoic acid biosynthesis glycosyltransferase